MNVLQNHDKGAVWISQQTYTQNTFLKIVFKNVKSISIPVDFGVNLTKATDASELVNQLLYRSAVGGLLYLANQNKT